MLKRIYQKELNKSNEVYKFKGLYGLAKNKLSEGIKHQMWFTDLKACMDLLNNVSEWIKHIKCGSQIQKLDFPLTPHPWFTDGVKCLDQIIFLPVSKVPSSFLLVTKI